MLHEKVQLRFGNFIIFLCEKLVHVKLKVCLRFKLLKKAAHKNNPWTQLRQQDKTNRADDS